MGGGGLRDGRPLEIHTRRMDRGFGLKRLDGFAVVRQNPLQKKRRANARRRATNNPLIGTPIGTLISGHGKLDLQRLSSCGRCQL